MRPLRPIRRRNKFILSLCGVIGLSGLVGFSLFAASLQAPAKTVQKEEAVLFKGLTTTVTGLGLVTPAEKKAIGSTIEKDKADILKRTVTQIYDEAYGLYRKGEYQEALTLLERILVLDPNFDRARALQSALAQAKMGFEARPEAPKTIKTIVAEKFQEAIDVYREGRKVEAVGKFEEVLALEPKHRKARYHIDRINGELAQEFFEKGKYAFSQGRQEEALEAFYSAINLDPKNMAFLTRQITEIESDLRSQKIKNYLTQALTALDEGRWPDARLQAKEIFKLDPANSRAQEIMDQSLSSEVQGYFAFGDALMIKKSYQEAIEAYQKVVKLGTRADEAKKKIELAQSKIKQTQEDAKKREEEEAAKKEAEDRARAAMGAGVEASPTQPTSSSGQPATAGAPAAEQEPKTVTEEAKKASESHYTQAIQFYQSGDLQRALAELNMALRFDPNNQNAYAAKRRIDAELSK